MWWESVGWDWVRIDFTLLVNLKLRWHYLSLQTKKATKIAESNRSENPLLPELKEISFELYTLGSWTWIASVKSFRYNLLKWVKCCEGVRNPLQIHLPMQSANFYTNLNSILSFCLLNSDNYTTHYYVHYE